MDKNTFLDKIKEIGSCEDDVNRRTMLTNLSDEVSKVFDNNELLNTTINSLNDSLTKANKDLEDTQKANMQLWLKVGEQKEDSQVQENATGIPKQPEKTYKSYDELSKGFIK